MKSRLPAWCGNSSVETASINNKKAEGKCLPLRFISSYEGCGEVEDQGHQRQDYDRTCTQCHPDAASTQKLLGHIQICQY